MIALQKSGLQHIQSGVLIDSDKSDQVIGNENLGYHSIPATWAKATMLVRCNSIVRGHSAVSLGTIEAIITLICNDFTPIIPLRGTISASGDLMPLSYVAGVVEGNPDVWVRTGKKTPCTIVSAKEALEMVGLKPITLRPKEGLGLTNGTAASTAVATLALYETHHLAVLSQILTAVAVEALLGNAESFHPFVAQVRPHAGQIEAARNIRTFLNGSKLALGLTGQKDRTKSNLIQDRYPVRSSSQWIGPQLEDLLLAHRQISVELNATSDNPLVDVINEEVYSGANFQAASITSAMEKTRLSLQMLGKMLFSQCTELINPTLNNGLPPNLAADDPSLSFTMKGVDVNMAAYMSELAFLSSPVSSHVQSAEMHNQAINSLAFISARYTMQAVEVTSLMCASFLYVGCQALDLRVLHIGFLQALQPAIQSITSEIFGEVLPPEGMDKLQSDLWKHILEGWALTSKMDAKERCQYLVQTSLAVVLNGLIAQTEASSPAYMHLVGQLEVWKDRTVTIVYDTYMSIRAKFLEHPDTEEFLGQASRRLYLFVRKELGVPFHTGIAEHPSPEDDLTTRINGRKRKTIGSWISTIYESLRSGQLHEPIMMCLEEETEDAGVKGMAEGNNLFN